MPIINFQTLFASSSVTPFNNGGLFGKPCCNQAHTTHGHNLTLGNTINVPAASHPAGIVPLDCGHHQRIMSLSHWHTFALITLNTTRASARLSHWRTGAQHQLQYHKRESPPAIESRLYGHNLTVKRGGGQQKLARNVAQYQTSNLKVDP